MARSRLFRGLFVSLQILTAAELAARRVPIPGDVPPAGDGEVRLLGNPWLLWELVPGEHREKGVTVRVNAAGLRGPEIHEKGWARWMAVGDSSVYGFGVEDDEVFTTRLAAARDVEVLNAAVPGYSTFQVLNQLRMRTLALDPDVLIVGTIWSDNNFDRFVDRDLLASYAGWEASVWGRARAALHHSALFSAADWLLRVRPRAEATKKVGWQLGSGQSQSDHRRVAIADYAANLDTLCRLMSGRGVIFLILPNREDLRPRTAAPAWNPYRDVMRDAAARCGAPVVDLPRVFSQSGDTVDALFLDEMHPTALGHDLIARALTTVKPGIAHDPGPRRVWTDPFVPLPGTPDVLRAQLLIAPLPGGRFVIDVLDGEAIVATTTAPGPGELRLDLPPGLRDVTIRVTLDAHQDGVAGDPSETLPVTLPVAQLDFSKAAFR